MLNFESLVENPSLEGSSLISPLRGRFYLRLGVELWNCGRMEYWESKADDGLIF